MSPAPNPIPRAPGAFYISLPCGTCGEDMFEGVVVTAITRNGYPVIPADMMLSQITFTCETCGGQTFTGDFEDMCQHEPGAVEGHQTTADA